MIIIYIVAYYNTYNNYHRFIKNQSYDIISYHHTIYSQFIFLIPLGLLGGRLCTGSNNILNCLLTVPIFQVVL